MVTLVPPRTIEVSAFIFLGVEWAQCGFGNVLRFFDRYLLGLLDQMGYRFGLLSCEASKVIAYTGYERRRFLPYKSNDRF